MDIYILEGIIDDLEYELGEYEPYEPIHRNLLIIIKNF